MYRTAKEQDLPALTGLWQRAFGDPEEYAHKVMTEIAGLDSVYLACPEGEPVSMLCAVPVTMEGMPGAYLYGLATDPAFQGKGLMTGLLDYAKSQLTMQGRGFGVLVPASASLQGFYAKRGFEPVFRLRRIKNKAIPRNLWATADFDSVTAARLGQLRQKFAPGGVMLPAAGWLAEILSLYSQGATTVETAGGYGIFFEEGDTLYFVELLADSDRDAKLLLQAAREHTGLEKAEITLGEHSELLLGEGRLEDYGMAAFWGSQPPLHRAYMRLMLE